MLHALPFALIEINLFTHAVNARVCVGKKLIIQFMAMGVQMLFSCSSEKKLPPYEMHSGIASSQLRELTAFNYLTRSNLIAD